MTLLGQSFSVDQNGIHAPGPIPGIKIPGVPKTVSGLLSTLGFSFTPPKITTTVNGATATEATQGLVFNIDLKQVHKALNTVPILTLLNTVIPKQVRDNWCIPDQAQVGNQLPFGGCVDSELSGFLSLSPILKFPFGNSYVSANASPPFDFVPPPFNAGTPPVTTTLPGTPGTPGIPGTSGTPGVGTSGNPNPTVAGPLTTVARELPAGFNGLKGAALLGALLGLLTWYLARNLGLGVIAGMAGCEYGAPRSVPDLRRE
jgi:hypothetical protein